MALAEEFDLKVVIVHDKTKPTNKTLKVDTTIPTTTVKAEEASTSLHSKVREVLGQSGHDFNRHQARLYRMDKNGAPGDLYPDCDEDGALMTIRTCTLCYECQPKKNRVVVVFVNATSYSFTEADIAQLAKMMTRIAAKAKSSKEAK